MQEKIDQLEQELSNERNKASEVMSDYDRLKKNNED